MAEEFIMTQKGYDEAAERLKYLQTQKKKEITERIKVARGFGDLSENAEYDAAKNEEALNESEIRELENMLKNAKIMEESIDNSKVHFGNEVRVYDFDLEEEGTYTLMGSMEADIEKNIVSIESPFGAALIGAKCGDTVTVHAPGGDYRVKILEIR
ncbi:MAG TPA: transcription elongation factor GreA [Candidatus Borkfalkia stercoripullorum]|nr:transcription elongation factor GreA [Candidatus Borkfalkia stercoripullorum]